MTRFMNPLPELRRPLASSFYYLSGSLEYWGRKFRFLVPREYRSDLGSVPRIVRWLVPSDGKYEAAFILHDYCIDDLKFRLRIGATLDPRALGRNLTHIGPLIDGRGTDLQLRESLADLGAPFVMRWLIWTGVRWAAPLNEARRSGGIVRDLPLMILWTLVALPILLVGTVPMLAASAVYLAVERLVGFFCRG